MKLLRFFFKKKVCTENNSITDTVPITPYIKSIIDRENDKKVNKQELENFRMENAIRREAYNLYFAYLEAPIITFEGKGIKNFIPLVNSSNIYQRVYHKETAIYHNQDVNKLVITKFWELVNSI